MTTINPTEMRKVAAFAEAINAVCKTFDMEIVPPDRASIGNICDGDSGSTGFRLVLDENAVGYVLEAV